MDSSDTSACVGSYKVVVEHDPGVDEVLLMVDFTDLKTFEGWAGGRTAVGELVPGLGDAAFAGPVGTDPYQSLCFRKGTRAFRVACGTSGKSITEDDLRAVADLVASRF